MKCTYSESRMDVFLSFNPYSLLAGKGISGYPLSRQRQSLAINYMLLNQSLKSMCQFGKKKGS